MNSKKSSQKHSHECEIVSLSKSEDDSTREIDESRSIEKRGIFFG